MWDCLAEYITDIICSPETIDGNCPDTLVLNQMVLLNMAYSMHLNREFEFNNFYSTLDESKLAQFTSINQVVEKIKEFCDRLECNGIDTTTPHSSNFNFGLGNKHSGCTNCNKKVNSGCGCNKNK